jgi:hypothetical protein
MNDISVNFRKNVIEMNFLNGSVTVPAGYGGYVVASGCGSGKTTIIKEIIRQKFNEGILYAASTIREVDEMYEWLMNNAVDKVNNYGEILSSDDIIVLHSENEESKYIYNLNPEEITRRKVVLCTHYKLLHDDPRIMIKQTFNIKRFRRSLTMIRDSVNIDMENGTKYMMPRQYILVDEIPSCDILKAYFQKGAKINLLSQVTNTTTHFEKDILGNDIEVCDDVKMYLKGYQFRDEVILSYNTRVKGLSYDPFPPSSNNDGNSKSIPSQLRKELLIDSFIENEAIPNKIYNFDDISDGYVKYNISDFIIDEFRIKNKKQQQKNRLSRKLTA